VDGEVRAAAKKRRVAAEED
jgi:hypothetical protein